MPGLELEAADGSGRVTLPDGETMIGRGPFLGIADKRVSRNHGLLEVVGEKLRIKSVHVNPCFYQPSGKSQLLPLEKNKWQWLCEGDSFSLLPDKYVFKVISTHSDMDSTLSNSQILDEEDELKTPESTSDVQETKKPIEEEPSCSTNGTFRKANLGSERTPQTAEVEKSLKRSSHSANWNEALQQRNPIQRKRELPAWMLQEGLDVQPLSTSSAKPGARRRKVNVEKKTAGECVQGRERLPPGEDIERSKECEQDSEKKSRIKTEQKVNSQIRKASPVASVSRDIDNLETKEENAGLQRSESPEQDEDSKPRSEKPEYKQPSKTKLPTQTNRRKGSDEEKSSLPKITLAQQSEQPQSHGPHTEVEEMDASCSLATEMAGSASNEDASQGSAQSSNKRIPCVYGQRCYRKNPSHFQQCSHPGDSDFHDVGEGSLDDNDERPECPYGTDCYRKNPQHKLEYKHSKPPETESGRSRRKTTQKVVGKSALEDDSDNDGEPNEYDLNDSFLDDEEEEYEPTDEDSDYEPDFEDKDTEDMDTLLKEAKTFVKTKK